MNHLGGMGRMVCVEWLHKAHVYGLPCVSHLWLATQEQRDWRRSCREASSAATCHMGSGLTD